MHKVASFNGELVPSGETSINALSQAALYGRGVFTTIAIYESKPFLLDKHWLRLSSDACKVGLDIGAWSFESFGNELSELIETNSVNEGRARVTIYDSSVSRLWAETATNRSDILITTADKRAGKAELILTVSPFILNSRSPLAGVKSCNYLENLIALKDAQDRGFDEALRLNELGKIASACMANIFWLKDDRLYTPSLGTGCLAGTTRAFILERFDCIEAAASFDDVLSADSVFICSAGIEIKQVRSIDHRYFDKHEHDLLHLLPPNEKTRMSAT